ncbi:aminotransferase class I/II-fold pyridoxal phosphate-dependent enzyme [Kytococcus sedentarius]|uniref:aminotransferase class I/II-fold pyridoxal phosphate-dependent enzyme n=1 Tax=Kytococcus sedentarius TaxID=1276 RepID=UPI0035BC7063
MNSPLVQRMQPFGTSIFAEMTQRALAADAVNLGQGAPDSGTPPQLIEWAHEAMVAGRNQYPPFWGVPELREAIAAHQQRFHGLEVDPSEVLVTVGATEALTASILALVEPGQEVIVIEPAYDSYGAAIALAGGVVRPVALSLPGLELDPAALEAAFSDDTAMVIVNTPHNPTGRTFSAEELALIGRLAEKHDAVILTDEVYEHLVFDGASHLPPAAVPECAGRTLTVSSAGKTFAVTGWKVGWVHGPAELVEAVAKVKQFTTFGVGTPLQPAIAQGLALPDEVFAELRDRHQRRRDLLLSGLRSVGFAAEVPPAGYFVIADAAPLGVTDALAWCRTLPEEAGVAGVPVQAFCSDPAQAPSLVRFGFCKTEDVIAEGLGRLQRWADARG